MLPLSVLGSFGALPTPAKAGVRAGLRPGFGVAALGGRRVELFLHLFEPDPNPLLMEVPDVAMERGVGLSQFLEVRIQIGNAIGDIAVELACFFHALVESLDPLLECLAELLEAAIGFLPGVVVHVDELIVSLGDLGDETRDILAERKFTGSQFIEGGIDMDQSTAGILQ